MQYDLEYHNNDSDNGLAKQLNNKEIQNKLDAVRDNLLKSDEGGASVDIARKGRKTANGESTMNKVFFKQFLPEFCSLVLHLMCSSILHDIYWQMMFPFIITFSTSSWL